MQYAVCQKPGKTSKTVSQKAVTVCKKAGKAAWSESRKGRSSEQNIEL